MTGDPHRALARALRALLPGLAIETSTSRPWASVTFTGARHLFEGRVENGDEMWVRIAAIGEAQFALSGHLVAEIVADCVAESSGMGRVKLEALTIEEA